MTITRIMQFANCRHRYYLGEILGLEPKVTAPALHVGTLAHVGKDGYYESLKEGRSLPDAAIAIGKKIAAASDEYEKKTLPLLPEERREEARIDAREEAMLAANLVAHFLDENYERDRARFGSLEGTEIELRAHIGRRSLAGHADALWLDKDGKQIVSEWKTTGDKTPNVEWINLSWQNVIYVRGVEEQYGTRPMVEYNILRKKVPGRPHVKKDGKVSRAACDTTKVIFEQALADAGQDGTGYEEILRRLEHNRFNWIIRVHRNDAEIDQALAEIGRVIGQITGAKRVGEPAFYRNTEACRIFSCPYRSICIERTPETIEANFTTKEQREKAASMAEVKNKI
jgi:hypothetical protein